jgi:hypothetical protein
VSARRVIVAFLAVDVTTWALSFACVGGTVPPQSYLIADVATTALLFVGLWFYWRVAWWLLTLGNLLGVFLSASWLVRGREVGSQVILIASGVVELGLLMTPSLRHALRPLARHDPSDAPACGNDD